MKIMAFTPDCELFNVDQSEHFIDIRLVFLPAHSTNETNLPSS